ncbi:hypothetical protein A7C99_5344 [Trichophyton rubrum]|uniref:Uncharacterized protein n=4 Tax=Trichophyton TaxID=5550 RepID=A0A178ESK4_TRIRU|nr:hypothetical protein A7C99_5344 [Trichophyton rubrum]
MGLKDKIEEIMEFRRLENRYARRKNRHTLTYGAQYVDGEYVYGPGSPAVSPTPSATTVRKQSAGGKSSKWGGKFWEDSKAVCYGLWAASREDTTGEASRSR